MIDKDNLRTIKSFVTRAGRISNRQKYAIENYSEKYLINQDEYNIFDFKEIFSNNNDVVLEIGFGMGDSLALMAKNNPEKNYIGIEVHKAGIGNILDMIDLQELKNIKIIYGDAVKILNENIADNILSCVQIYFPDPWHKSKHHKRRLVNKNFIDLLLLKLKLNGIIHFATDWQNYALETLKLLSSKNNLKNDYEDFSPRPDFRPYTKFEKRGKKLNHGIWDIIVSKTA